MMATFSKEKDRVYNSIADPSSNFHSHFSSMPRGASEEERLRILEEYQAKIHTDFSDKLQDIGARLLGVFKKLHPLEREVHHYLSQEFTVSLIKELIGDLLSRVDVLLENLAVQAWPKGGVQS